MSKKNTFSRRAFLGTTLAGVAGLTLIPGCGISAPSDTLRLGFIGLGRQTMFLAGSFMKIKGVKVVAGSDVYGIKKERFAARVKAYYEEIGEKSDVKTYDNYKDLLNRKDIDAVVIASPDHWHYHMATDAISAGKDVYLEKPLTFTIAEGQKLVKAVRSADAILAVGSQQRSDDGFLHAIKMASGGNLGTIEKLNVFLGPNPHPAPYDLPEQELPSDLNWEEWLGPNPYVHYNSRLNPAISLNPPENEEFWAEWRYYKEVGGGLMTDWGAHMFDIAQWGIGKELTGPSKVVPAGYEDNENLKFMYEDGLEMEVKPFDNNTKGVKFFGSKDWIEVSRGKFVSSNESLNPVVEETDVPFEARSAHHVDFVKSVKDHIDPVAPVEIGHRTNTVCVLGNIAHWLGRPIEWDPKTESFKNDAEASAFLTREYNNGYTL
ncbi:MAG: Gfo/Idh/MocA family oxidoreductase [Bacteroidales bacterium]